MVTTQGQQAAINDAVALATQTATIAAQNVYLPSPPQVEFDKVTKQFLDKKLPSCTNPPNIDYTALIDSAGSITILNKRAKSNRAKLQEIAKSMSIPNGSTMKTTETLDFLLDKLPPSARTAHRCPGITNNLLAVSTLCNDGCSVIFLGHGVTVEFNGEIVLRGWRDQSNNLWRFPITSEGEGHSIIPSTPPVDYNPIQGIIMQSLINSIYECDNKK